MNLVDSSAWLSYFAGDKNAGTFARPIEAFEDLLVSGYYARRGIQMHYVPTIGVVFLFELRKY